MSFRVSSPTIRSGTTTPHPTTEPGCDHTKLYVGRGRVHTQSHKWARARPRPTLSWARTSPTLGPRVTTPSSTLGEDTSTPSPTLGPGVTTPNFMLGAEASIPNYLLSLGCELTPTSLRLGVKLKSHFTLSPPYLKPELIIMMPIIVPLNTNK